MLGGQPQGVPADRLGTVPGPAPSWAEVLAALSVAIDLGLGSLPNILLRAALIGTASRTGLAEQ